MFQSQPLLALEIVLLDASFDSAFLEFEGLVDALSCFDNFDDLFERALSEFLVSFLFLRHLV
jgi:hypothetical protein